MTGGSRPPFASAPYSDIVGPQGFFPTFQTHDAKPPSKLQTRGKCLADGSTARMTNTDTVVEFDSALIERARKGDQRAFERLYRDHVGRVHGLCLRMTRNPDHAADCVQD